LRARQLKQLHRKKGPGEAAIFLFAVSLVVGLAGGSIFGSIFGLVVDCQVN
jgi:hypothetical protein